MLYKQVRNDLFLEMESFVQEIIDSENDRTNNPYETIKDVVEAFGLIDELYGRLDHLKTQVGTILNRYKVGIVPSVLLDEHGQTKGECEGLCKVNLTTLSSVSVKDKEALISFLDSNNLGDIVTRTVSPQTLQKIAKEASEGEETSQWIYDLAEKNVITVGETRSARMTRGESFIKR